ncbi:DUF3891 family protein [Falsiroseomonas tokyonensis]|uniref:DUF3891 family protein n=1 Tax=Falsiroseomonas tokyonensis TaxID=430521 RepID=A0ABV7BZH9_9PROT|nr:DUF3891 family protein [Falsiroseomonas tokyonensis]MBU8539809.1 DUF3891 family protein [Falsiroseomonas tokyonensis]
MLLRDLPDGSTLAISQPMHALVSGQLARAWGAPGFAALDPFEEVATACAQHDVAWMDWEAAPTLDATTGRPHVFRAVGARSHAPMWAAGVARALASWGPWVALLVSRHGSLIYGSYADRHQLDREDAEAAERYLTEQAVVQHDLAAHLGATEAQVQTAAALVAVTDALSLAVCGGIETIGGVGTAPMADGSSVKLALSEGNGSIAIAPWPFRLAEVTLTWRARRLPAGAQWTDEAAMRADLAAAPVQPVSARLVPG